MLMMTHLYYDIFGFIQLTVLQMSYMSYIMKKQHLSSFVAGQGTLVPCVFRQTFKQALVAFLFVLSFFFR